MKRKSGPGKAPAEQVLKDVSRQTRRHYSAEEKIRLRWKGVSLRGSLRLPTIFETRPNRKLESPESLMIL